MTIIVTARTPGQPAPPPGILYYTFDCVADIYHDVSGNGHEGINGGASVRNGVLAQTNGLWGNCLHFEVNNGPQEFSTPDAPDLGIVDNMSAIAWVKPYGPNDSDPADCTEGTIFAKGAQTGFSSVTTMTPSGFKTKGAEASSRPCPWGVL